LEYTEFEGREERRTAAPPLCEGVSKRVSEKPRQKPGRILTRESSAGSHPCLAAPSWGSAWPPLREIQRPRDSRSPEPRVAGRVLGERSLDGAVECRAGLAGCGEETSKESERRGRQEEKAMEKYLQALILMRFGSSSHRWNNAHACFMSDQSSRSPSDLPLKTITRYQGTSAIIRRRRSASISMRTRVE
jgi:hypothetical protein